MKWFYCFWYIVSYNTSQVEYSIIKSIFFLGSKDYHVTNYRSKNGSCNRCPYYSIYHKCKYLYIFLYIGILRIKSIKYVINLKIPVSIISKQNQFYFAFMFPHLTFPSILILNFLNAFLKFF